MKTAALALATLLLIGGGAPVGAATYDEIMAKGEITVAVYRDFPPFSSRQDGHLVGVDVDLATAIAQRLHVRVAFMELTAGEQVDDDLRNAVWKGHYLERRVADVMMHVPTDRDLAMRNPNAVIFAPYYRERLAVARDPEKINSRDGIEIFAHEKVGVELASLADMYLTSAQGGRLVPHVVHFPTVAKAVDGLAAGEVAAVMGTETELAASLGERGKKFTLAPMATPGLAKPWWDPGVAVKDSNRQLGHAVDDAMSALRLDGTVAAIFHNHGLPYIVPQE